MSPVTFASNSTASPLTPEERAWLRRVNKVLQECPSARLAAATMGDSFLVFYDKEAESRASFSDSEGDFIPFLKRRGLDLADVYTSFRIDSTSG